MTEYAVSVHSAMSGDCVPLIRIADAMARRAASGHGMISFHKPTFDEIWPRYVSLLLDAARTGQLTVCDNDGRMLTAKEAVETAFPPTSLQAEGVWPQTENDYDELNLGRLYAKSAHLVAWGNATGDVFKIIDAPVEIIELENGGRGMVGLPCQADEQSAAPSGTPESDKPVEPVNEIPVIRRKRNALINELVSIWPSIERDLSDASRKSSGLSSAAKLGGTFWDLTKAVCWAVERGKITKAKAAQSLATDPDSVFSATLRQLFKI